MAITPNKTDVDITQLFVWSKEFEITNIVGSKALRYWMRLVGDSDINRARSYALRKSAELRKLLNDESSDDHIAFISAIEDVEDPEDLLELLAMLKAREFVQEAEKEIYVPFPKEPNSDASQEENEKYQVEVDAYPEKRQQALSDYVVAKLVAYKKEKREKPIETLRKEYVKLTVNQLCEREMISAFRDYCVFAGSYKDEKLKTLLFPKVEDFLNLPSEVKEQFVANYESLELNVDELKKSLEATL